jgi:hypothetical protein
MAIYTIHGSTHVSGRANAWMPTKLSLCVSGGRVYRLHSSGAPDLRHGELFAGRYGMISTRYAMEDGTGFMAGPGEIARLMRLGVRFRPAD